MSIRLPRTFGDVAVGDRLPAFRETPTNVDLFLINVPYWGSHRIHYDYKWARSEEFEDVVVPSILMYTWVERALVRWAGDPGTIRRYRFRHTGLACVGCELHGAIEVTRTEPGESVGEIECAISVRTTDGREVLTGAAILELPMVRSELAGKA